MHIFFFSFHFLYFVINSAKHELGNNEIILIDVNVAYTSACILNGNNICESYYSI